MILNCILLVDFGSTYTKLTVVNVDHQEILCTSKSITTVQSGILEGYQDALDKLSDILKKNNCTIIDRLGCSSAAGGLKMSVSGLVKQLTSEAAKLACLGSGAKILDVYSQKMTGFDMKRLLDRNPDMILLAGGTDGGNTHCIVHNSKLLSMSGTTVPIVVAGNKSAYDIIENVFWDSGLDYRLVDNVMPELNKIEIDSAREAIREIFMDRIIDAKGLGAAKQLLSNEIIPTPMAVLRAAELLSSGTDENSGWGPLMIIDIGGATTDVHSVCDGSPTRAGVMQTGLVEPYIKRTVEGDLGMRISALSLLESVGTPLLMKFTGETKTAIESKCQVLHKKHEKIPENEGEIKFDEGMAKAAVNVAVQRHVGQVESIYSPMGMLFYQKGKDLSNIRTVIGTGGVLVHSQTADKILNECILDKQQPELLKPLDPEYVLDESYMLSATGLLSEKYPELSMALMNKYLVKIGGKTDET